MMPDLARRWARRLPPIVTRVPFLVTAAVIVILFIVYTLAGFFLVPRLIASYVPRYAQEQLKRRVEIGEVRVNPLLFKLEIRRFRLQESDGRPLLGFDRLFVDFELSSLFRAAWTFADIQLDTPRLDVVLGRDGRLNVAELLDAFPRSDQPPPPAATAPRRVLLQRVVVRGGRLTFTDLTGHTPQMAAVDPINVELHNITTLPERRGPYAITATLTDGGVVGWDGEVSLFPLGSTGRLGIQGFPLATAWRFAQQEIALAQPSGKVDGEVRYQLAYREGAASLKVEGVDVTVAGLILTQRGDKSPLLALEKIRLTGGHGDLIARELTVPEISVSRGRLAATMARDGTVNWQALVVTPPPTAGPSPPPPPSPPSAPPSTTAGARPWRVAMEKIRVEEVALAFTDQSRATALAVDVSGVTVDLSARLESGPAGLTGTAEGVGVTLARVAVREAAAKAPVVALEQISVEGGHVDLGARQVAVSRLAVTGGTTTMERASDGSLPVVAMLRPVEPPKAAKPTATPAARAPAAAAAKPWSVAVAKVDVLDHRLALTDRSVTPAVALQIEGIKVGLRDLRTDGKKPALFEASFRVAQGGRFTATGQLAPDGSAAEANLALAQMALKPAQPYIAKNTAVELRSGEVSTTGRLTYRSGRDRAIVTYTGSVDLNRLLVVEAANGEPVLAWKSLHAAPLRFGLAPDRLEIDEVRLAELDGSLVIFQDKSLNLARLMRPAGAPPAAPPAAKPEAAGGQPPPSAPSPTRSSPPSGAAAGAEGGPGFPVAVERVRLEQSSMHFADLSLALPFRTRVHSLSGVVSGLRSDPTSRAAVKLDGRVDEFGLVKVDGTLIPFQPKLFTDITVSFRNVPMNTMTPYSVTFAGRRIASGTMNLDLEYKIERSVLLGDTKIVLQQLQLGERVESPGAMRLPLDLAIAILSDSEGRINVEVPVRGNVDHPEFSYGSVIWQALVSVITRVVTSPFRALAGLFGGDSEKLEAVAFEAGSDSLLPPERQKLRRVAEVLDKRPRLKLTVHGGYEAKVDGEALRSLRVRRDLAQRLGVKLGPEEDPGPVAFDSAKTQRALEAVLSERSGGKAIEEFQASYEKTTGKKAQRANPVLALVDRASPDREFYEALFRRLVETTPLVDADLTALGQRRGEATLRALKEGAGANAARVEVGDPEAAQHAERNAVPTRLELGAAGS